MREGDYYYRRSFHRSVVEDPVVTEVSDKDTEIFVLDSTSISVIVKYMI